MLSELLHADNLVSISEIFEGLRDMSRKLEADQTLRV